MSLLGGVKTAIYFLFEGGNFGLSRDYHKKLFGRFIHGGIVLEAVDSLPPIAGQEILG